MYYIKNPGCGNVLNSKQYYKKNKSSPQTLETILTLPMFEFTSNAVQSNTFNFKCLNNCL